MAIDRAFDPEFMIRPGTNGGLIADASGDLFGTMTGGGGSCNCGAVLEIAKTGSGYGTPTTIASFTSDNGAYPYAGLIADSAGNLFGTTQGGGAFGLGTAYEIAKIGSSYGTPTTIASFSGSNGANPTGELIADSAGDLLGTTKLGGVGSGTLFEITDSGFVTSVEVSTVPEPASLTLLATALLGTLGIRRLGLSR